MGQNSNQENKSVIVIQKFCPCLIVSQIRNFDHVKLFYYNMHYAAIQKSEHPRKVERVPQKMT